MNLLTLFFLIIVGLINCAVWLIAMIASFWFYKIKNIKEITVDPETAKKYGPLLKEACRNKDTVIRPEIEGFRNEV